MILFLWVFMSLCSFLGVSCVFLFIILCLLICSFFGVLNDMILLWIFMLSFGKLRLCFLVFSLVFLFYLMLVFVNGVYEWKECVYFLSMLILLLSVLLMLFFEMSRCLCRLRVWLRLCC